MPALLIDRAMDLVTSDLISRSSTFSTSRSPPGGSQPRFPVVLASVANRADDPWFVGRLYDMATSPDNDPGILDDVSRLVGSRPSRASVQGHEFISLLSGGRTERFHGTLSRFSGIRPSTAAALLAMVGPVVLGLLGRAVRQGNLAATGLSDMLRAQKSRSPRDAGRRGGHALGIRRLRRAGRALVPGVEVRHTQNAVRAAFLALRSSGARVTAPSVNTGLALGRPRLSWRAAWALSARARNRTVVEA